MHLEVAEFLLSPPVQTLVWQDATVIEVGAKNVNGKARDFFRGWALWEGMDLEEGPEVDYVGDASALLPKMMKDGRRYTHAVTTEVLEHSENWESIIIGLMSVLHPGGHLVVTAASTGRRPHGMSGSGLPEPGEYYQGIHLHELTAVVEGYGAKIRVARSLPNPGDIQLVAKV